MSIYNGWTPSISKQELDKNTEATLRAMVDEYPDNEYWRNRLADFLSQIEAQHDLEWLGTQTIISGGEVLEISNVTNPDEEIPL